MPTITEAFPVPPQAKKLEVLLGNWDVAGTMTMEGTRLNVDGKWNFEKAAAGWGAQATMKMQIEGMGAYEESDIVGYDPGEGKFHVFSLTNTGATHDHKGDWKDDNTLFVEYDGLQDGKKLREEITLKIAGPKQFAIHETDTLDGDTIMEMDVTLKK